MRIDGIKLYTPAPALSRKQAPTNPAAAQKTSFSGKYIKENFLKRLESFISSKIIKTETKMVIKAERPLAEVLPAVKPLEVKDHKKALHMYLRDENFSGKVMVKNPKDGSCEIYERRFDAASHETRINADCYDIKGRLHHTTIYDNNGLLLSKYYVKINNPKDPILIRRKDYNVNGKLTREEIKYKNGDVTYVDYDYLYASQTFKTVKPDGSSDVVKNTKYSTEIWNFDKDGKQTNYKLIEY